MKQKSGPLKREIRLTNLATLTKMRRKKTQINKIRFEKVRITTNTK
jgi:hypothetical protein